MYKFSLLVWIILLGGVCNAQVDSLGTNKKIDSLKMVINHLEARNTYDNAIEKLEISEKGIQAQRDNFSDFYAAFAIVAAFLAIVITGSGVTIYQLRKDLIAFQKEGEREIDLATMAAISNINNAETELREQITTEIARIAKTEQNLVSSILNFREQKDKLRKESRILVVNNSATKDLESFHKALSGFNITPKPVDKLDELDVRELTSFDLVIVENLSTGKWETEPLPKPIKRESASIKKQREEEDAERLATHHTLSDILNEVLVTTPVILYTKRFGEHKIKPDRLHKLSFANMPSQLYGNVMNLLKFMEISKTPNA